MTWVGLFFNVCALDMVSGRTSVFILGLVCTRQGHASCATHHMMPLGAQLQEKTPVYKLMTRQSCMIAYVTWLAIFQA